MSNIVLKPDVSQATQIRAAMKAHNRFQKLRNQQVAWAHFKRRNTLTGNYTRISSNGFGPNFKIKEPFNP